MGKDHPENPTHGQETPQHQAKKELDFFYLTAAALILLTVIISSFGSKPTDPFSAGLASPQTTSSDLCWETVTLRQHGLSFRHPDLEEPCCDQDYPGTNLLKVFAQAETSTSSSLGSVPVNGLQIYIHPNPYKEDFITYVEKQKTMMLNQSLSEEELTNPDHLIDMPVTVGGQNGIRLKHYPRWSDIIFVPFPDQQRILIIGKTNLNQPEFQEVFNQILHSVTFAESH